MAALTMWRLMIKTAGRERTVRCGARGYSKRTQAVGQSGQLLSNGVSSEGGSYRDLLHRIGSRDLERKKTKATWATATNLPMGGP